METILRISDVRRITGLSRSSIYAKAARNEFPHPIKLGDRAAGWLESEISAWLEDRIAESRRGIHQPIYVGKGMP
ncbi:AlpA family transcriptional regulator [Collimonas sp. OK307]|uniref:helix-turn-helix transcriptional regulator n=1 Tax=Collimonas sp. OK307 TaxID=1801620 RepID=UPI000B842691|nr:AlpA family phage regulatory protein [Collimonas sp. OK307]